MKLNRNYLVLAGSVVLGLILMVYVLARNPIGQVVSTFHNFTPSLVIAYLVVSIIIMIFLTLRWKILLNAEGHKNLPFLNLMSYRIIDYGVSYVTPTAKLGGEPVRAAMLMRHGISFKEGLVSVTIDKTIELSLTLLFFVFGCTVLVFQSVLPAGVTALLAAFAALVLYLMYKFYSRILRGQSIFLSLFMKLRLNKIWFLAKYKSVVEEFERPIINFYRNKKKAYFMALGCSFVAFILSLLEYWLILKMVGIEATMSIIFLVFSVVGFAFMVPVPLGLGSLEAFQAWLFESLHLNTAAGVGLAMITRTRDVIWVLMAFGLSIYYGSLRKVLEEAYNAKYSNPIVRTAVFRGGEAKYINIRLLRDKPSSGGYVPLAQLRHKHPFFKGKYEKKK